MVGIGIWSIMEANTTVICICLITLKPVLKRLYPSSMLGKTRQGWSKLLSPWFQWSPRRHSSTHSRPSNEKDDRFTRLYDSNPQAPAVIELHSKPAMGGSSPKPSIPMQVITGRGDLEAFTQEVV